MLDRQRVAEMVSGPPADGRAVLEELAKRMACCPGRCSSANFGNIRKWALRGRDREQPHLQPASTAELLWYRDFITRAFLDTSNGPQEFACIPADLLFMLPEPELEVAIAPGRAATAVERAVLIPATDAILDQIARLLAAQRLSLSSDFNRIFIRLVGVNLSFPVKPQQLKSLLAAGEFIDPTSGLPNPDISRHHLESPRNKALAQLARAGCTAPILTTCAWYPDWNLKANGTMMPCALVTQS